MAPPIGQNTLNSLARHYILPQITDNAYFSNNALLYRLLKGNKKMQQGGTHIEVPLMYRGFVNGGGSYRGYDPQTSSPQDTVKNAYLDWKQYYKSFSIDGLTLIKADTPLAVANIVALQGQQMNMEMAEALAAGIYEDGVADPKGIDGLAAIADDSNVYGGLDRTTDTWWQANVDSSTATLSFSALRTMVGTQTFGGTSPSIIIGNGTNYNRLYTLGLSTAGYGVSWNRQPGGSDTNLMQAGFTNVMFENIPFIRDDNAGDNIYVLNEDFLSLVVSPRADFYMDDFEKAQGQDAYTLTVMWAGNLMCTHSAAQGVMTAVSG